MGKRALALLVLYAASAFASEAAESTPSSHLLQAILLETFPFAIDTIFDVTDLPSADFPVRFSRLFAPFSRPQSVEVPEELRFPRAPMFLDIYTFAVTEPQVRKKKSFSRHNGMQDLDYKVTFLSWSTDRYHVELRGRHADLRWNHISVDGAIDRTKVVRIRHTPNRVLFIVLTAIDGLPAELRESPRKLQDVTRPAPIIQPLPIYPSALSRAHWSGLVRIRCIVTREGRIDREKFVLLEVPHYLFARNTLDTVLNSWTFRPGAKDGSPVDVAATVEISFQLR
jgi:hypothetical protein